MSDICKISNILFRGCMKPPLQIHNNAPNQSLLTNILLQKRFLLEILGQRDVLFRLILPNNLPKDATILCSYQHTLKFPFPPTSSTSEIFTSLDDGTRIYFINSLSGHRGCKIFLFCTVLEETSLHMYLFTSLVFFIYYIAIHKFVSISRPEIYCQKVFKLSLGDMYTNMLTMLLCVTRQEFTLKHLTLCPGLSVH